MEENKENVPKKLETRIPLPLYPLPPLPIQLLKKKEKSIEKRQPLQTLATNSTSKILKKLDMKFVTLRKKPGNVDSDYKIFKDNDENIIVISDDEAVDENIEDCSFLDGNKICLNERLPITPSESSRVQHLQVRNIKRSLKRPSSRELQGLSPPEKQEKSVPLVVKRRLQFTETLSDTSQSSGNWKDESNKLQVREYTDDMLSHLLASERPPTTVTSTSSRTRSCLINWLMKVNGPLGNPGVVQSACWYLDSILSTERVQLDRIQLLGVACYWIAQKLHGNMMSSSRLTFISDNAFTQAMLLDAEKRIIVKLGFPVQPVIPQEFIAYLAWWCDKERPQELETAANFLCMSGMMVVKELSVEYPSVIACASILTAGMLLRGKNSMTRFHDCPVFKTAKKKSGNFFHTCAVLRKAVKTIADPSFEYKVPLAHFGGPPHYIADHVINAARRSFTKIDEATMT